MLSWTIKYFICLASRFMKWQKKCSGPEALNIKTNKIFNCNDLALNWTFCVKLSNLMSQLKQFEWKKFFINLED